MTLLATWAIALAPIAAAQDADPAERARASEPHQALEALESLEDDIAEGGVSALVESLPMAVERVPVEDLGEGGPGTIQAATLYVCTQYGGVNVAPGTVYCEYEWVAATCEEVGYVSGVPSQSSDGVWIWGCNDDPPGIWI